MDTQHNLQPPEDILFSFILDTMALLDQAAPVSDPMTIYMQLSVPDHTTELCVGRFQSWFAGRLFRAL